MSLPDRSTVLIVGAGPAGLAAALSLLHRGIHDLVIVDAIPHAQNSSRAVGVHAATLEALDTIGCAADIVSQGIKHTAFNIRTRSTKLISTHFESLKPHTQHPYTLIVTQNLTERTLEKRLGSFGVIVYRPLKVAGLMQNPSDPQLSDVIFEDGRVITTKYVVGADGARSLVRTLAGIGFSDPMNTTGEADNNLAQAVIADVTFDIMDVADHSTLSGTLSTNNFFICFPLPSSFNESLAVNGQAPISEKVYRIGCGVPLEEGEIPHSPSKKYLQNLIDRFGPSRPTPNAAVGLDSKPMNIKDVVWSSRFRNRSAIADNTFIRLDSGESEPGGVVLLVGDAAHIHSPVGGHGMNLGVRDAIFLGEALTKHIRATETKSLSEADEILREFSRMRRARALKVIRFTQGLLSVFGMKYRERMFWWCPVDSATVRAWGLWVLGCIPFIQRRIVWELSGLLKR